MNIVISVLIFSLFVTIFMITAEDLSNNYNVTLDNATKASLGRLNRTTEFAEVMEETSDKVTTSDSGISAADLLGGFFKSGYTALLVTKDSFVSLNTMSSAGLDNIPMDERAKNMILVTFSTLITVAIILGIIVAILVRRDKA